MKKERSAFFQNQSSSYYYPENNMPNFYMPNINNQMPMTTKSNSSFYQGPIQTNEYNLNYSLDKLKEDILNLEKRITKLESELNTTANIPNNNMYMI